jgi:hypothetical protein
MRVSRAFYATAVVAIAAAFLLAGTGISEAAKKKKAKVVTPPVAPICSLQKAPVCAQKGKLTFTYANACFAANDGAKISYYGACKKPKAKKAKKAKKAAKKK